MRAAAAATLLGDIGTEKSVPALQEAAKSGNTFLADAAREAMKKLQPGDEVTEALLDLETGNVFKKREALQKLAKATPDEARREKVAAVLETQVLGRDLFTLSDDAGPALANWAGKNTVTRLLPLLDENTSTHQHKVAMEVFAKTKDKRTVFPVVRWILKDTDNVTKCLIEMGPVAEDEVIKLTKQPEAAARAASARILQEIGTAKSLAALKRASTDPRDATAAAAARIAWDIVNERVKATRTTAPTSAPAR
jgi:HEAT repeat protein